MLGSFGLLQSSRAQRIASVVLGVVTLILAAAAILATVTDLDLKAHGVTTNATIVNVLTDYSRKSGTTYTDRIEFTTGDGSAQQASIGGSSSDRRGETVAVVYDPGHPGTVQPRSSITGLWWLGPTFLALFAALFGWLAAKLWRRARRVAAPQDFVLS
jgi:hypothetical protein